MSLAAWFARIRTMDVRILAAIGATLLLVFGVMWTVPTTPSSDRFTFDASRRGISSARPLAIDGPIDGRLVDGSDTDYYKLNPTATPVRIHLRVSPASSLILGLRVFDSTGNLIVENPTDHVPSPGGDIDGSFQAHPGTIYYVQVFSHRNTTGSYRLNATED
jgi:hypothetical protein